MFGYSFKDKKWIYFIWLLIELWNVYNKVLFLICHYLVQEIVPSCVANSAALNTF